MNNNRCLYCQQIIPEGRDICPSCENEPIKVYETTPQALFDVRSILWKIVSKEAIEINNQNIDWILERVYKELCK